MLRKRHQYRMLQAAFVLALVGVAFFGSYQGSRSQRTAENATPPPAHGGGTYIVKEPEEFWEKFLDPLSILTGVLAFVTYLMARAVTEQVRLAHGEFLTTHRPRLRVRKVAMQHYFKPPQHLRISCEIANVGATVATLEKVEMTVQQWRPRNSGSPYPIAPTEPYLEGVDTTIRRIEGGAHIKIEIDVPIPEMGGWEFSINKMHVRGDLTYKDSLKIERHTSIDRVPIPDLTRWAGRRFSTEADPDPDYEYED